jgi:hypothetical protein
MWERETPSVERFVAEASRALINDVQVIPREKKSRSQRCTQEGGIQQIRLEASHLRLEGKPSLATSHSDDDTLPLLLTGLPSRTTSSLGLRTGYMSAGRAQSSIALTRLTEFATDFRLPRLRSGSPCEGTYNRQEFPSGRFDDAFLFLIQNPAHS